MANFNKAKKVSLSDFIAAVSAAITDSGYDGAAETAKNAAALAAWHKANATGDMDASVTAALEAIWPEEQETDDDVAGETAAETVGDKPAADMSRGELLRMVSDRLKGNSAILAELSASVTREFDRLASVGKLAITLEGMFTPQEIAALPVPGTHSHTVKNEPTGINNPDFILTNASEQAAGLGREKSFWHGVADTLPEGLKAATALNAFKAANPGAGKKDNPDLNVGLAALRKPVEVLRAQVRKAFLAICQMTRLNAFPHFEVSWIKTNGELVRSPTNVKVYCGGYRDANGPVHNTRVMSTATLLMLDLDLMESKGGDWNAFLEIMKREPAGKTAPGAWPAVIGATTFLDGVAAINTWSTNVKVNSSEMTGIIEAIQKDDTGTFLRAAQDIHGLLERVLSGISQKEKDKALAKEKVA